MFVALDSNILIASLSGKEEYSLIAQQLIRDIVSGKHKAIVSSIAYGEVLSVSNENLDLEGFFSSIDYLDTIPASDSICLKAGRLRLENGSKLRLPDAIHAATALSADVDIFVTNDKPLSKITQSFLPTTLLSDWI
jgi:predicted nucleic acid-binding protein